MTVPRLITSLSNEEYHASAAISKSGLDLIHRSPLHYWSEKFSDDLDVKRKRTRAMDIGTAFHTLALEPDKFDETIAVAPRLDLRTTKGKDAWAEFSAANASRILLREDDMSGLHEMAKAIRGHAGARYLLKGKGYAESSLFWRNELYEADCRARPDWLREDGLLIDLKTTENASPEVFTRHFWNMRYHVQAAFYVDGYKAVTGKDAAGFVFIAVEKTPPYAVSVHIITPEYLQRGRLEYWQDLQRYGDCVKSGEWPGYGNEVHQINPPAWAK